MEHGNQSQQDVNDAVLLVARAKLDLPSALQATLVARASKSTITALLAAEVPDQLVLAFLKRIDPWVTMQQSQDSTALVFNPLSPKLKHITQYQQDFSYICLMIFFPVAQIGSVLLLWLCPLACSFSKPRHIICNVSGLFFSS